MMCDPSEQVRDEIESIDTWLPEVDRLTPLNDEWLIGLPFTFHKGAESDIAVNLPRLLELIDPQPGSKVLEVGAGTTWLSNLLAREGCTVVATDVTRRLYVGLDSADVLIHHSGTVFDRVVAEMDHVPCVDETFDIVAEPNNGAQDLAA
jgi:2-polyprenyl-3-methyl-5-hydroxy-6-metoxy-1,4-benzoquinol methylase